MSWRTISDWAKHKPLALRVADHLGRSRGRLRPFDNINHLPHPRKKPDLANWESKPFAAVWIGHATLLLRIDGVTLLTDPVFSSRVGLGLGMITAGPKRFQAPALSIDQLPPLDLILVSHAHFDHLDRPSLCKLDKRVPIVTTWNNSDLIRDLGFADIRELRLGESTQVGPLKLTARKVQHWGARTFFDQHRGFAAFLLESPKRRVLYGADTGFHDYFHDIAKVDLAIFGIGAYDPYIHAHANPEQVLAMANHVKADYIFPMHHTTFRLSHEPMNEPLERLLAAAGEDRIVAREVGDQWEM